MGRSKKDGTCKDAWSPTSASTMRTLFRDLIAACKWVDLAALRTTAKTVLSGFAACAKSSANGMTRCIKLTDQLADVFQADASGGSDNSVRSHGGVEEVYWSIVYAVAGSLRDIYTGPETAALLVRTIGGTTIIDQTYRLLAFLRLV